MPAEVYLETARLRLRNFTTDDLDNLIKLDGDPLVKRYIDNGAPVDPAELADVLDHWLKYYEHPHGYGFWAAVDRQSRSFLGWFHFRPGEGADQAEPELGYRLRRNFWGKGLATEGSQALIDKGFTELSVERVYAQTMAVNWASRRVMEKCGMRLVRVFKSDWPVPIPGEEEGDVEYAISRSQWESSDA